MLFGAVRCDANDEIRTMLRLRRYQKEQINTPRRPAPGQRQKDLEDGGAVEIEIMITFGMMRLGM